MEAFRQTRWGDRSLSPDQVWHHERPQRIEYFRSWYDSLRLRRIPMEPIAFPRLKTPPHWQIGKKSLNIHQECYLANPVTGFSLAFYWVNLENWEPHLNFLESADWRNWQQQLQVSLLRFPHDLIKCKSWRMEEWTSFWHQSEASS